MFLRFMNCLFDLHSTYYQLEHLFSDIRNEFGNERYEEALSLKAEVEGIPDDDLPPLSDEQIEIIRRLIDAEDKSYEQTFMVKLMRYELQQAFEALVESNYPRRQNG